jgi:hypothetical protein
MTMKLFPHVLIRISGGPFEQMETLNLGDSAQLADQVYDLGQKLEELKQKISDRLYDVIPQKKDPKIQNLLLDCRRKVFNERDISAGKLDVIIGHLPNSLKKDLIDYLKIKENAGRLWARGEKMFEEEILQRRKNLHALALGDTLQKGLVLSSQSLLKRIPTYVTRESGLNKKDLQTERGLMKYISRMYGKTSPFSTFTNLVMGKPSPAAPAPDAGKPFLWTPNKEKGQVVYHIRLNNFLYSYLKILLCQNPHIYRHFLIRPNPTIKKGDDHYLFLTNNDNIEAFQRIPENPVLEVFQYLTSQETEGISLHRLIQEILENEYIDAPAEELEGYILQLIEYGFLEYNIGVSGIDPDWDIKLGKVLGDINRTQPGIPLLGELLETLENIRTLANRYGQTPCGQRNSILEEAFQQFRAICMKLHEAAGLPEDERKTPEELQQALKEKQKQDEENKEKNKKEDNEPGTAEEEEVFKHRSNTSFHFKPEQMFYEDTTVDVSPHIDESRLQEYIESLHELLRLSRHYEGMSDEREKMRYFFANRCGESASVPLMTFYEEFYREFKKPEAELQKKREAIQRQKQWLAQQENEKNDNDKKEKADAVEELKLTKEEEEKAEFLKVPTIQERQEKNKQWQDRFQAILKEKITPDRDMVSLYPRHVEHAHREMGMSVENAGEYCSYGTFTQFYLEETAGGEEKLMGVLNSSFPGFGKLFSRFLHIFDDSVTGDVREWNRTLQDDTLLVEDTDASYFNANLHPPLLPHEVRIPGGHNTLPSEQQIPITQLEVRLDKTGSRLQLFHVPTEKRAYVIDLGFQGHKGRSQLFQLLEKFSLAQYLFPLPITNTALSAAEPRQAPDENAAGEPRVTESPRVVYDDRIVLRRKSWQVPVEKLPFREPKESSWSYFERVNRWRRDLRMPDEVFVFVVDRMQGQGAAKPKAKQSPTRDDYKPQYICFKNPFLIDLFERLIKRVGYNLRVVEMLPNSRQLLKIGDSRHITEFTVQWYTYPDPADTGK